MQEIEDIYAMGSVVKHFLHKHESVLLSDEVSRCSSSKHQQVLLPKLISQVARSPH